MHGIYKIHNAIQSADARKDWHIACRIARQKGAEPPSIDVAQMGWRRIESEIRKLLLSYYVSRDEMWSDIAKYR